MYHITSHHITSHHLYCTTHISEGWRVIKLTCQRARKQWWGDWHQCECHLHSWEIVPQISPTCEPRLLWVKKQRSDKLSMRGKETLWRGQSTLHKYMIVVEWWCMCMCMCYYTIRYVYVQYMCCVCDTCAVCMHALDVWYVQEMCVCVCVCVIVCICVCDCVCVIVCVWLCVCDCVCVIVCVWLCVCDCVSLCVSVYVIVCICVCICVCVCVSVCVWLSVWLSACACVWVCDACTAHVLHL
jgi:hypothetical protein